MHVFVTGATGFVGYHTVLALTRAGHSVRLGVRNAEKMHALYAGSGIDTRDYTVGEITDSVSITRALKGCDAVVHTAAMVSLDPSDEERMRHTNLRGTELVVGGAVTQGIETIVHVSSLVALFDPQQQRLHEGLPLASPRSAYARSKIECDRYVRGLVDAGANIALTYPSAVVGPDDPAMSEGNQGLAYFFNRTIVHTTSGMQFIDVRELADAHLALLQQHKSGCYLVTGHFLTHRKLGELLDSVTGQRLRKLPAPRQLLRVIGHVTDFIDKHFNSINSLLTLEAVTYATDWVVADDSKIREELQLEYRPLRDTMRDTILWMADAGHIEPRWTQNITREE